MLRAVWPPSWDWAFSFHLVSVANYDCSVIDFTATAILFSDHARFVKLPGGLASIDSDRHRMILGVRFNCSNVGVIDIFFACNSAPSFKLAYDLVRIKSTLVLFIAFMRLVGVVCFGNSTFNCHQPPCILHPPTITTSHLVVIATGELVARLPFHGAVNYHLLRQVNWLHKLALCHCLLPRHCSFDDWIGCVGPARTTLALVFYFAHVAICVKVYRCRNIVVLQTTSLAVVSVVDKHAAIILYVSCISWHIET